MTRESTRNRTRTNMLLPTFLALAILPAVVGCIQQGRLLEASDFEYRHPAVRWVYSTGWQIVDPPPNPLYDPLGLPRKIKNDLIRDMCQGPGRETGSWLVMFTEDADIATSVARRTWATVLDVESGGFADGDQVPKPHSRFVQFPAFKNVIDSAAAGYDCELLSAHQTVEQGLRLFMGRPDQQEPYTLLLEFAKDKGPRDAGTGSILFIENSTCIALSIDGGYLVLIDVAKIPCCSRGKDDAE